MIYRFFFSLWLLQLFTVFSFGSLNVEPKCSRFDFEEKLLEKAVKLEHTSGLMAKTFKEFSTQMKTDLQKMKDDFEEMKAETKTELARLEQLIEGPTFLVPGPTVNIASDYRNVFQISEWQGPQYPAVQAVDGNLDTFSHTGITSGAWWSMQWCDRVIIARVKIWSRNDCPTCNVVQMSHFDVTVDGKLCGSVGSSVAPAGHVNEITCTQLLVGKRLKIQRTVEGLLAMAEVQVFSS